MSGSYFHLQFGYVRVIEIGACCFAYAGWRKRAQ